MTDRTELSPREAAFVAEISTRTVHRAIDRKEVRSGKAEGGRFLGVPEVLYLRVRQELMPVLSKKARKKLYHHLLVEYREKANISLIQEKFELGLVHVEIREALDTVAERMEQLEGVARYVVQDEEIGGGEPVVQGTRIPVYLLAELVEQGATHEELYQDYPSLKPKSLEAALIYTQTHPRRGRKPKTPPWRQSVPA